MYVCMYDDVCVAPVRKNGYCQALEFKIINRSIDSKAQSTQQKVFLHHCLATSL